jgi:hypothetical protein
MSSIRQARNHFILWAVPGFEKKVFPAGEAAPPGVRGKLPLVVEEEPGNIFADMLIDLL